VAALPGKGVAVKMLCERGADVGARNAKGETPLALAATGNTLGPGSFACATVLVEHGALVQEGERSRELGGVLLHTTCASAAPSGALLKMFIANGLDITARKDGQSALHTAAFNDNLEAVKILVDAGLDVRAT
jgi:ankyrin repeat protein